MQQRVNPSLPQILGIGMRLFRRRNEVIALVRQMQQLIAEIMGPADATPQHAFDVKWVQQSLNQLTGSKLAIDGDYGEATKDAVKRFQKQQKLEVDGWVGVLTLAALEQAVVEA